MILLTFINHEEMKTVINKTKGKDEKKSDSVLLQWMMEDDFSKSVARDLVIAKLSHK